jgi:hypothetical protein
MQILGLFGMYFDTSVVLVFVTNSSLLFRFTLAIVCQLRIFQDIFETLVIGLKKIFEIVRVNISKYLKRF